MKRVIIYIILFSFTINLAFSQKVGLVMSGGGARGLAHVGVIKALEENNIPIDYVTGTSMGAIVAALYSMGYSATDMEELFASEDFNRWYTGEFDKNYMFYFRRSPETPDFISVHLDTKDSLRVVLPSLSLIDPSQMNLGFLEIFSEGTAACKNNFDSLFVPFRCVASDVHNKQQVIFSQGDLGDAVRASMSFPFVFKPIKKDSILLYDGGIYNNFPADVMQRDFSPDIIIGSVVSKNPTLPKDTEVMTQMENLIMAKSDYTLPDSIGIVLNFKLDNVSLLEFNKLQPIAELGYTQTMEMMDSIKQRIPRRENSGTLAIKRKKFNELKPKIQFREIKIQGATPEQQRYIKSEFHDDENEIFSYADFKRAYFRLLSGDIISSILPHAQYNPNDSTYTLHLDIEIQNPLSLSMGGGISSDNSNQIYFGIKYRNLNNHSKEVCLDGQLGKVYNNIQFSGRVDFVSQFPVSLRLIASYSTLDYYNSRYVFTQKTSVALNQEREAFLKLKLSLPFLMRQKAEFAVGIGTIKDNYIPSSTIDLNAPKFDTNRINLSSGSIKFEGNTLNTPIYPTSGKYESIIAQMFIGNEKFKDYNTTSEILKMNQAWLQMSYSSMDFYKLSSKISLGTYLKVYYSTRGFSFTYQSTMMQAGTFTPTINSLYNYNPAYRANQYFAAGVIPTLKLNDFLQLRGEIYGFLPYRPIKENSKGKAYYGKHFSKFEYISEIALVCRLSSLVLSGYIDYYSSNKSNVDIGISLGWFVFNDRFIE